MTREAELLVVHITFSPHRVKKFRLSSPALRPFAQQLLPPKYLSIHLILLTQWAIGISSKRSSASPSSLVQWTHGAPQGLDRPLVSCSVGTRWEELTCSNIRKSGVWYGETTSSGVRAQAAVRCNLDDAITGAWGKISSLAVWWTLTAWLHLIFLPHFLVIGLNHPKFRNGTYV